MSKEVKVYVTMGCPFCQKMMAWLDKHKVKHERVVFSDSASKLAFYEQHPGVRTVPQLFVDGERIGGWSDLQSHKFKQEIESQNAS